MKKFLLSIGIVLVACSCYRRHAGYSVSDFLTDRNNVLSCLSESLAQAPQGAELSQISAMQPRLNPSIPGDKHIISVIKRQRWTGGTTHHVSLDLSDALLSSTDQGSSSTNTATKILYHYFSGLSRFGFRSGGSPGGGWDGRMLFAENTWFKEGSNNILIFGHVYVDPKDKTALVVMDLSEWY